jgi:hypothetical protein
MVDDTPPHNPEQDDHDDLAALDFSATEGKAQGSDLDAIGEYVTVEETDVGGDDLDAADPLAEAQNDELVVPLFTVTNPPGTVTVTTHLDGRVHQIDLSPKVTTMTETHLAEEIVVIAGLATQGARSAQYTFMLEGMREQGHDDALTRDFLLRDLDLPSPEDADAARAEVFASRYAGDHD